MDCSPVFLRVFATRFRITAPAYFATFRLMAKHGDGGLAVADAPPSERTLSHLWGSVFGRMSAFGASKRRSIATNSA